MLRWWEKTFNSSKEQKAELDRWMNTQEFDSAEKIEAVTHIYNILGIDKLAQQKIEELFALSLQSLDKVKVAEEKKAELLQYASYRHKACLQSLPKQHSCLQT